MFPWFGLFHVKKVKHPAHKAGRMPVNVALGLCAMVCLVGCGRVISSTPGSGSPTPFPFTATAPALPTRLPTATFTHIASPTLVSSATLTSPATSPTAGPTPTRPALFPTATPVGLPAPTILTFTFAPALINPGGAVTLTWEVVGAEQVTVNRVYDYRLTLPAYEVPLTGTLVLTTYESERNFANFVLFATAGERTTSASVIIPIRCPDSWFFDNPPVECPFPAVHTLFVAQDFEHGQMLWAAGNDRIYILYAGGLRWSATPNSWFEGMPESDPALVPPAGYYQPVRGFGVVWRDEQALEGTRVRDQLGWAVNEEYAWGAGVVQCTAVTKYSTCYLGGPGTVIYRLKPEGSGWEAWLGPNP